MYLKFNYEKNIMKMSLRRLKDFFSRDQIHLIGG